MCQINYTIKERKNKPLDEFELSKIESMLDEGYNATLIAEALERDVSTIQKEIKNFSTVIKITKECKVCIKYEECTKTKICGNNINIGFCAQCKGCKIAVENCEEYIPEVTCKKLKGIQKTCNSCPRRKHGCEEVKRIYIAREAWKRHQENKQKSRKKLKAIENKEYMEELSKLIIQGIAPEVALGVIGDRYGETISVPTLYYRIDKGKMRCKNIHLRNKLKREVKEEKTERQSRNDKHRANGRSYGDLTEEEKQGKLDRCGQMDTVIGKPGGKLLLTLLNKKTSFLFGIPIQDKKQETIIKEIDQLEITIADKFKLILEKILTDNGGEFLNYEGIEKSAIQGKEKRIWLYYADPYASYEKGQIENQHRLIRYFFPKGTDFSKYSNEVIIEKMNRINNYPRKDLGWSTPYKEMEKIIGTEILNKLGFYEIPINELNMTRRKVA